MSKSDITSSLRNFKNRRDDLLHEDASTFEHHLSRFVEFCQKDELVQGLLLPIEESQEIDVNSWWEKSLRYGSELHFGEGADEELLLRYRIIENVSKEPKKAYQLGKSQGQDQRDDFINMFRSVVIRPFVRELTERLGKAANLASPEARSVQAVPLRRIPSANESKIFLSHKSVDKPLVMRYYDALKESGFEPWLDEPNMPAGSNLERGIRQGFKESCAAVFFITEDFKDKKYLASEVDYAVIEKRQKENKFAIITLRYSDATAVPDLLDPYIYKDVDNDLEGYYELLRALPVELGPIRWKVEVVE